jgi:hypothetical protein
MGKFMNFLVMAPCILLVTDAMAQSSTPIKASVTTLACYMTVEPSEGIKKINEQYKETLFFTAEDLQTREKMAEEICAKKELTFSGFDDDKKVNCTGSYNGVATSTLEEVNTLLRGQIFIAKKYGNTNTGTWENDEDVRFFNRAGKKVISIAKKLCKTVSNDFDRGDFI